MHKTGIASLTLVATLALQGCATPHPTSRVADTRYCEPGSAVAHTLPTSTRVVLPARPAPQRGTCKS